MKINTYSEHSLSSQDSWMHNRKKLGLVLKLIERLAAVEGFAMFKQGCWKELVELESLNQLRNLMPGEAINIRDIFQFLMALVLHLLVEERSKALASDQLS